MPETDTTTDTDDGAQTMSDDDRDGTMRTNPNSVPPVLDYFVGDDGRMVKSHLRVVSAIRVQRSGDSRGPVMLWNRCLDTEIDQGANHD